MPMPKPLKYQMEAVQNTRIGEINHAFVNLMSLLIDKGILTADEVEKKIFGK